MEISKNINQPDSADTDRSFVPSSALTETVFWAQNVYMFLYEHRCKYSKQNVSKSNTIYNTCIKTKWGLTQECKVGLTFKHQSTYFTILINWKNCLMISMDTGVFDKIQLHNTLDTGGKFPLSVRCTWGWNADGFAPKSRTRQGHGFHCFYSLLCQVAESPFRQEKEIKCTHPG